MNLSDYVSLGSIILAGLAIWISLHTHWGALKESKRPILVFSMTRKFCWKVENVGPGPAVSVVVVDLHRDGRKASSTLCYPISAGGFIQLTWLNAGYKLIAYYEDVDGNRFVSTCEGSRISVRKAQGDSVPLTDSDQWLQETIGSGREICTLKEEDLEGKTDWELDIMRNEPYAQRGYTFSREDLQRHFLGQSWYSPTRNDRHEITRLLTEDEMVRCHMILAFQLKRRRR